MDIDFDKIYLEECECLPYSDQPPCRICVHNNLVEDVEYAYQQLHKENEELKANRRLAVLYWINCECVAKILKTTVKLFAESVSQLKRNVDEWNKVS